MAKNRTSKPRNVIVSGANITPAAAAIIAASRNPVAPVANTAPLGTVAGAQAATSNVAPAKPATAPAKPTGDVSAPAPAIPARIAGVARTAATIAADRTNFGMLSDRDAAYLSFYAGFAKAASDGIVTVLAIATAFRDNGAKPAYSGSCKPHDAGVIVRLTKAGICSHVADGTSFTFTERGKTHKAYAQAAKRT